MTAPVLTPRQRVEIALLDDDADHGHVAAMADLIRFVAAEGIAPDHFCPRDRAALPGGFAAARYYAGRGWWQRDTYGYAALAAAGCVAPGAEGGAT